MTAEKILFLSSGDQICRSLIAKHTLQSLNKRLEVFAGGIAPLAEISDEQKNAMKELGYEVCENDFKSFDEYLNLEFDYLITVSHGVREQLKKYPRNYAFKLHMEFSYLCNRETSDVKVIELYRKIREEVFDELNYFHSHILKSPEPL